MGSRSTQFIGLKQAARELVRGEPVFRYNLTTIKTFPDGRRETERGDVYQSDVKVDRVGFCHGMFNEQIPLSRFTMGDGRVYQEYVQSTPWSSGPVIFTALKDADDNPIEATLWTEEEQEQYV